MVVNSENERCIQHIASIFVIEGGNEQNEIEKGKEEGTRENPRLTRRRRGMHERGLDLYLLFLGDLLSTIPPLRTYLFIIVDVLSYLNQMDFYPAIVAQLIMFEGHVAL
jgi:hypothetical protein